MPLRFSKSSPIHILSGIGSWAGIAVTGSTLARSVYIYIYYTTTYVVTGRPCASLSQPVIITYHLSKRRREKRSAVLGAEQEVGTSSYIRPGNKYTRFCHRYEVVLLGFSTLPSFFPRCHSFIFLAVIFSLMREAVGLWSDEEESQNAR